MSPIDFFTVLVRYKGSWSHASEYLANTEGDAVDQLLSCKGAEKVEVIQTTAGVGEPYARDKTPSAVARAISTVLDAHDFHSDSPPEFPTWCELQGNRAWRKALAEMQGAEAHVHQERANLTVGAFG